MSEKIKIGLSNVQITLLLPLWGRAMDLQKKSQLLNDTTASDIINKIEFDFTRLSKNIHPVTQNEWIARSLHIDRTIKNFLITAM